MTNESAVVQDKMEFKALEGLRPEDFTTVFGDCFISGFLEGGEFSAIISIKVHDKSKVSEVKLAAEATLVVGPSPVSVEAGASIDRSKKNALRDTETTISVNWSGGGDIKTPGTNWDLATVVAAANEFPRRVADVSSRTSAILTKYTALRSFHVVNAKVGYRFRILDYELCSKSRVELQASGADPSHSPIHYRFVQQLHDLQTPLEPTDRHAEGTEGLQGTGEMQGGPRPNTN